MAPKEKKKRTSGREKDALAVFEKMNQTLAMTAAANAQVQREIAQRGAVLDATYSAIASEQPERKAAKASKTATKVVTETVKKLTSTHQVKVDFYGGVSAQVSTEVINLGVRAIADWAPDGWFAENVDFLQGAPHFILGLGVYIAEMATRKDGVFPTTRRETISEASKLFAQLGFSNIVRALRVRFKLGKTAAINFAALEAEKKVLEGQLRTMQAAARAAKPT